MYEDIMAFLNTVDLELHIETMGRQQMWFRGNGGNDEQLNHISNKQIEGKWLI